MKHPSALIVAFLFTSPLFSEDQKLFCLEATYRAQPISMSFHFYVNQIDPSIKDQIIRYNWSFGNGDTGTTTINEVNYLYAEPGFYVVSAIVVLSNGDTLSDTITIRATAQGQRAILLFSDITDGPAPLEVQFKSNVVAFRGAIFDYFWEFGDGATSNESLIGSVTHAYTAPGQYTAKLTVTDFDGFFDSHGIIITVTASDHCINGIKDQDEEEIDCGGSCPPCYNGHFTLEIMIPWGDAPHNPHLNANFTLPGLQEKVVKYEWHFGNGEIAVTDVPWVIYEYQTAGNYTAFVVITDIYGRTFTSNNVQITVTADLHKPGPGLNILSHQVGNWEKLKPPYDQFDPALPTTVIVHGWNTDCFESLRHPAPWREIATLIYLRENNQVNILGWDWMEEAKNNDGSCGIHYTQVPGHEINNQKNLLTWAMNNLFSATNYSAEKKIVLMGHSLGAHIVAWCGSKLLTPEYGNHNAIQVILWDPPTDKELYVSLQFIADIKEPINKIRNYASEHEGIKVYTELYDGKTNMGMHGVHLWIDVPGDSHDVYNWYKTTILPINDPQIRDGNDAIIFNKTIGYSTTDISKRPSALCLNHCETETVVVRYNEKKQQFNVEKDCAPCEPFAPETTTEYLIEGEEITGDGTGVIDGSSLSFWIEILRRQKLQNQLSVTCAFPVGISDDWDYVSFDYTFIEAPDDTNLTFSIEVDEETSTCFLVTPSDLFSSGNSGFLPVDKLQGEDVRFIFKLSSENAGPKVDIQNLSFLKDISHNNLPPVANAGADTTHTVNSEGIVEITLSGIKSSDPEVGHLWFLWLANGSYIGDGPEITVKLVSGIYTFTLQVTDEFGASDTDEVVITVIEQFIRGDVNQDNTIDIGDTVVILAHLFLSQPIDCLDAADTNDNGELELADAIYILNFIFMSGPMPIAPFPALGPDPTPDALNCAP